MADTTERNSKALRPKWNASQNASTSCLSPEQPMMHRPPTADRALVTQEPQEIQEIKREKKRNNGSAPKDKIYDIFLSEWNTGAPTTLRLSDYVYAAYSGGDK